MAKTPITKMIYDLGFRIYEKSKIWINTHKVEFAILLLVLAVGAFFRLYRIDEYMTFLGDEGRDVIVVRRLLVYADPILIGPGTSIGNMYLGPLYYYMMAPALLLANFSPVGPAVQIAILGVLTIFLIWFIARSWFGKVSALLVTSLYALSPTAIIFSRSSWNPNIMPFFSLLTVYSIWKVWKERNYKWLIVLGITFAFVLNSHYLGIMLIPVIFLYWVLTLLKVKGKSQEKRVFIKYSLLGLFSFAILMSPLVLFDLRHNFQNFRAMREFVTNSKSGSFKNLSDALAGISNVLTNLFVRLPGGRNYRVGLLVTVASLLFSIAVAYKKRFKLNFSSPIFLIVFWIGFGVIGLAFVQKEIYDHYMGFLFPAPYLFLAWVVSKGVAKKIIATTILPAVFIVLVFANLSNSPLRDNPPRQLARSMAVSEKILSESESKRFNLAVLAESNYEDGYRYFLEVNGAEVMHADIWDKNTISDELFVVCEKPADKCDPTHSSKAEIVNFGWTKIDNAWEIKGVMLYKLGHFKP